MAPSSKPKPKSISARARAKANQIKAKANRFEKWKNQSKAKANQRWNASEQWKIEIEGKRMKEQKKIKAQQKEEANSRAAQILSKRKHTQKLEALKQSKTESQKEETSPQTLEEQIKEFEESAKSQSPDLPEDSLEEMLSEYERCIGDKDKEEDLKDIILKIEIYFLQRLLLEGSSEQNKKIEALKQFHFCVCKLDQMQKYQKKVAVLPWYLFDRITEMMGHVRHRQGLNRATLRAGNSAFYSWWLGDFLECIVFGLRHARNRRTIQNFEGATFFIHCKLSMAQGEDVRRNPHNLPNLQDFRVCDQPVFPDYVLKITLGATGFFDPATQIHLVQIYEHACNIQIR